VKIINVDKKITVSMKKKKLKYKEKRKGVNKLDLQKQFIMIKIEL